MLCCYLVIPDFAKACTEKCCCVCILIHCKCILKGLVVLCEIYYIVIWVYMPVTVFLSLHHNSDLPVETWFCFKFKLVGLTLFKFYIFLLNLYFPIRIACIFYCYSQCIVILKAVNYIWCFCWWIYIYCIACCSIIEGSVFDERILDKAYIVKPGCFLHSKCYRNVMVYILCIRRKFNREIFRLSCFDIKCVYISSYVCRNSIISIWCSGKAEFVWCSRRKCQFFLRHNYSRFLIFAHCNLKSSSIREWSDCHICIFSIWYIPVS